MIDIPGTHSTIFDTTNLTYLTQQMNLSLRRSELGSPASSSLLSSTLAISREELMMRKVELTGDSEAR